MFVPCPTATHREPFQATPKQEVVKTALPLDDAVQLIPLYEYASVVDPDPPPATHMKPFHATHAPKLVSVEPAPIQVVPL